MHEPQREREEMETQRRNLCLRERNKGSGGMEVFLVCARNFHTQARERESGKSEKWHDEREINAW